MDKFNVYNQFPELYDQIYGGDDHKVLEFVNTIFSNINIQKTDPLLDMGAGTGGLLIALTKEDYNIKGYEPYDGMMAQAIMKSKALDVKIKISRGSFETLNDQEEYKVVLAMNGPLHFVEQDNITEVFKNVSNSIISGGYFLIDLINFYSLIKYYQYPEPQQFVILGKSANSNVKHTIDLIKEKWIHQSVIFIQEEIGWNRIEDTQVMSMYNLNQMKLLGSLTGLKFISSFTSYKDLESVSGARLLILFQKT